MSDKNEDEESSASDTENLTHRELMEVSSRTINELLSQDPLLSDLPEGVTLEEVNAQLALEQGQSMSVYVMRADGEELHIVVPQQGSTVLDLKNAIKHHVNLTLLRAGQRRKISWRYIWRTYWIYFNNTKLRNDSALLSTLGIKNHSHLTFVKRLRDKGRVIE